MSIILALETSTNACSAALQVDGQRYQRMVVAPREHAERILGMVSELCKEAAITPRDLEGVAFGQGPGSFLGTRIAAGVAQGLGFSLNIPLFPISSLQALAQGLVNKIGATEVVAAWDARLGSVYWGHYRLDRGRLKAVTPDAICQFANFSLPAGVTQLVGNAWELCQAALFKGLGEVYEAYPEAIHLLPEAEYRFDCGQGIDAASAGPVYLRDPV
jgi:tRNA threonylcarbamoyladenosine biosynthesis protein TsaB